MLRSYAVARLSDPQAPHRDIPEINPSVLFHVNLKNNYGKHSRSFSHHLPCNPLFQPSVWLFFCWPSGATNIVRRHLLLLLLPTRPPAERRRRRVVSVEPGETADVEDVCHAASNHLGGPLLVLGEETRAPSSQLELLKTGRAQKSTLWYGPSLRVCGDFEKPNQAEVEGG